MWAQGLAPSGQAQKTGSAAPDGPSQSLPGPLQQRDPRYQLCAGDVIDVGFTFSPEFNQTLAVQPDGFVTLRDAGDIKVEGMSVPEVRAAIVRAYANVLNKPEVTVTLKQFEKPYFIATGQVTKPGKYELHGSTRLTEAIALAGGFTDAAKYSQVVLFRRVSREWMEAKVVDVKKMLAQKDLREDPFVNPGDLVYVPQTKFSHLRRYIPAPGVGLNVSPGIP